MTSAAAQTWHYGLVSRWWAEFNLDGPEIEWFRPFVEAGQPALDAACGTGRLLVPYLQAGLDVDGSDISPDMLERVRERCEREGLPRRTSTRRRCTSSTCPRRYRTIIVCGGFGLGGRREHDVEGAAPPVRPPRARRHPRRSTTRSRTPTVGCGGTGRRRSAQELPRPWRDKGDRRTVADGSELELRSRVVDVDPLAQRVTHRDAARSAGADDELVAEEEHTLAMTLYFTHELELELRRGRFRRRRACAAVYEDRPPTADDDFVVFIARK